MKKYKKSIYKILFLLMCICILACSSDKKSVNPESNNQLDLSITIPPGANSWVVNSTEQDAVLIHDSGIHNWTSLDDVIRVYFHTKLTGELHLGLNIKSETGPSTIRVTVGNTTKDIVIDNTTYKNVEIGMFDITKSGYNFIEIQGLQKTGEYIGDINKVFIGGPATTSGVSFVPNDFSFHFGRRGPSVHLTYKMPENKDVIYFYNEVTIPKGEDVVGSYFMANGFGEGYFGIQVNSDTERRILFSVWSPFVTDDPSTIPDDYKIILLGKGEGVTGGSFGGEGSGGQSYKVFDWKPENTYKFLLKGEPSVNNSTDYTAYFYAPEEGEWKLIASFRRPHTNTYLKGFYSFLENFRTHTGFISRKGKYANQWVYDTQGQWHELTNAKFTADATARKEARLDYAGGVDGNSFYLKNCGFFDDNTTMNTEFSRTANGVKPDVDFSQLPGLGALKNK
ncbi:uncharacterized protein DUF5077 [Aquimarina sp. MAR_2010_214]|uniref:DUF3472 domain-containing protein n=1 Tax=Aquimarina sp. MAR_2010_214 TaxID=1250026 RepID=UPI000C7003BD|nr:DUF3472 domain-containing protein [Aquimarina sp. MAR_2010_214]PKV52583.1 uncharacterized protein DUF5077 [Aquimarina sp. MAR_2010_214]